MARTRAAPRPGKASLPESPHFSLERVTDGVYAALAARTGGALSNSTLVDLGTETLVFDTFISPQAATDLIAAARKLFGNRPFVVANSHYHYDHVRGNQKFPEARIIGTGGTWELLQPQLGRSATEFRAEQEAELDWLRNADLPPDELEFWRASAKHALETIDELKIVPPNITFEDRLDIHGSSRRAQLLTYGGGHTKSDAFLYLPEDRIVSMGDLLTVQNHPSLADGDPTAWDDILGRVLKLRFDHAVPGHGPVGSPEDFGPVRDYFRVVAQRARDLARSGGKSESTPVGPIPGEYQRWGMRRAFEENVRAMLARSG